MCEGASEQSGDPAETLSGRSVGKGVFRASGRGDVSSLSVGKKYGIFQLELEDIR